MSKKSNVIPLFPNAHQHIETHPQAREGAVELELYEETEPREAGIGDWIMENCNALPLHEDAKGRIVVAVPIHTFDELVVLVVDCVNDYESMKEALEKIAGRGNELERKIANDTLIGLSTNTEK